MERIDLLNEVVRDIYDLMVHQTTKPTYCSACMEMELEKWMSKQEVMDYFKISKSTYYRWVKQGKLLPRKRFGEDRYFKRDILKLLQKLNRRERY